MLRKVQNTTTSNVSSMTSWSSYRLLCTNSALDPNSSRNAANRYLQDRAEMNTRAYAGLGSILALVVLYPF